MDEVSSLVGDLPIINSLITEESIAIEQKGIDQKNESNLAEFIGATNEEIKIQLGNDSRRWVIIEAPLMSTSEREEWKDTMRAVYTDFFEDPEWKDGGAWAVMAYYLKYDIKDFVPYLHIPRTEAVKKCIEMNLPTPVLWWKYILSRRRLEPERDEGHNLDDTWWTWPRVYSRMRTDDEFSTLLGAKREKMTEAVFKEQLSTVASIRYDEASEARFKFRPWMEQYRRWKDEVPDVALPPFYLNDETTDLFTAPLIRDMQRTRSLPGLDSYTDREKDYLITRLYKEQTKKVTLHPSFYLRHGPSVSNKDIIEFE